MTKNKRKSPVRHAVKQHTRKGRTVQYHVRGQGTKPTKVVKKKILVDSRRQISKNIEDRAYTAAVDAGFYNEANRIAKQADEAFKTGFSPTEGDAVWTAAFNVIGNNEKASEVQKMHERIYGEKMGKRRLKRKK